MICVFVLYVGSTFYRIVRAFLIEEQKIVARAVKMQQQQQKKSKKK
jgi:hypothetical protein